MKRGTVIGFLVLFILIAFIVFKNSFAREYEVLDDTIFTYPHDVCIDPGHGGPTAQRYNNNGDGQGTLGCSYTGDSLSEQWVNLQVAYYLKDFLCCALTCPLFYWQKLVITRLGETDIDPPMAGFWQRIMRSRYGNAGRAVNEFISIHHNGFPSLSNQGSETFTSPYLYTLDSNFAKDTSTVLARKTLAKILDYFISDAQCYQCYEDRGTKLKYDNYVLNRVVSTHVLPEASDIHLHCDQAALFDYAYPNAWHARVEANGIFEGWCSYKRNAGFVTVKNKSLHGEDGWVIIDGPETPETYFASPYSSVWRDGETWRIVFLNWQYIGGVMDTFHHVRELETGIYSTNPSLFYTVPQCSTHTIIGYYRGGPYEANLFVPDGGEIWLIGDSGYINWSYGLGGTSAGVDSTTLIDVFLDRNSGQNGYPEVIFTEIPRKDYMAAGWQVTGPASTKCRIKIVAHDCVDNTATDVSSYDFTIRFPNISGDVNTDGIVSISDVVYLINYLFKFGPGFEPIWKGDTNGDCSVSLSDVVYLINYLTKGGPELICDGSCWACMRAVVKEDENPIVKDSSLAKKIYKQ